MQGMYKTHLAVAYSAMIVLLMLVLYICPICLEKGSAEPKTYDDTQLRTITLLSAENTYRMKTVPEIIQENHVVTHFPEPEPVGYPLLQEEMDLIALVTMAEAGGEPEEGQRLVIDSILNRVDSPYFPDTVYEVIYQKYQYSCVWNGALDSCYVRDDILELVKEESLNRTNSEAVFFRTKHYHSYGVPLFQVGHHYFSKYA